MFLITTMTSIDSPTEVKSTAFSINSLKPFSISVPASITRPGSQTTPKNSNPKKRPHSSLANSDSEDEATIREPQLVASFDHAAGGAISIGGPEQTKAPLVIQGLKNRNWREESRRKRGKNLLPAEVQAARSGHDSTSSDIVGDDPRPGQFGLSFVKTTVPDNEGDVTMADSETGTGDATNVPKTVEEEAIEALIGNAAKKSTLILPGPSSSPEASGLLQTRTAIDDDGLFRSDVASRPDSAKLEDYAAVPVEEFGAALLRGMGWKEGDVVGKRKGVISKARVAERRPALLGIGAKEVPVSVGEELGAWGKVAKGKRKTEKAYNPVLLKHSKTGELLTEEELEAKRESRRKEELEWKERRDRNLAMDDARKSERAQRETRKRRRDGRQNSEEARSRSAERRRRRSASSPSSSRRHRSRSAERSRRGLSRRERSRSADRSHGARSRGRHQDGDAERYEGKEREHRNRDRRKEDAAVARTEGRTYRERDEYDELRRRRRQEIY
jgi:hypothetical protein